LSIKKSDLLNKFSNNYPSFLKKDLKKFVDIFLSELKNSLKRHERVELRDIFSIEPRLQKAKFARNPKTNEKIFIKEKYSLIFKTSKFWTKKINEEK
tara:strand:- start:3269 stop:3559 length:291 start_codon:yes stop_codon:yes gene_type:complete